MNESIQLKPHMTKEEYTKMLLQDDVSVFEHWDLMPCDCEYQESCTGWKLMPKDIQL